MSDPGAPAPTISALAAPSAPAAPAAPAAPSAFDWASQNLDAETSTYVAAKGWKTPADVLASYRGAEKLLGVPADKVVKIPTGDFNQQVWNEQVFDRLGRPKDAAGYELTKLVPAGADTKFAEAAAGKFHEVGLNAQQAKALTEWWNGQTQAVTTQQSEAAKLKNTQDIAALQGKWGQAFESNSAVVDKAAASFGMKPDQVAALKTAMGAKDAMEFLFNIGQKMGVSDEFISPDGRQTNFAGGMTADQAKQQIADLRKDKGFMDKYLKGDAEAKQRMTDLHRRASPGTLTL